MHSTLCNSSVCICLQSLPLFAPKLIRESPCVSDVLVDPMSCSASVSVPIRSDAKDAPPNVPGTRLSSQACRVIREPAVAVFPDHSPLSRLGSTPGLSLTPSESKSAPTPVLPSPLPVVPSPQPPSRPTPSLSLSLPCPVSEKRQRPQT